VRWGAGRKLLRGDSSAPRMPTHSSAPRMPTYYLIAGIYVGYMILSSLALYLCTRQHRARLVATLTEQCGLGGRVPSTKARANTGQARGKEARIPHRRDSASKQRDKRTTGFNGSAAGVGGVCAHHRGGHSSVASRIQAVNRTRLLWHSLTLDTGGRTYHATPYCAVEIPHIA